MTLRWRRTPNGLGWISSPVSTSWVRDIIYELYPADDRMWGRHRWSILKSVDHGPRYSQGVRGPLAVAKALCAGDLVEEKSWQAHCNILADLLEQRTKCTWSYRQGRGTSANNIYVSSPSERKHDKYGTLMALDDRQALADAFKMPLGLITDMVMVTPDQYAEHLDKLKE